MSDSDSEIDSMLHALGLPPSQRSTGSASSSQPTSTSCRAPLLPRQPIPDSSIVDLSETSPLTKRSKVRSSPILAPAANVYSAPPVCDVIELTSDSEPDTHRHTRSPSPSNPVDVSIISINTNSDEEEPNALLHNDDDILPYEDEDYFNAMQQGTLTYSPTSDISMALPPSTPSTSLVTPDPVTTRPSPPRPVPPSRPRKRSKPVLYVALEASWSESEAAVKFKEALASHTPKPIPLVPAIQCDVSSVVLWDHAATLGASNEPILTRVPMACRVFPALDFLAAIDAQYAPIYDVIGQLRNVLNDSTARIFLVVEGMDKALIAEQRKQRKTPLTFAHVQHACVHLFMNSFCHIKFTTDVNDTAQYLYSLTREIGLLPQADEVDFLTHVGRLTSLRATPDGDTSNELTNTWLRMLQMVPGMSEERAQRVVGFYPTMQSLLQIYHNPALPVEAKEVVLAEKINANSIEIVLSKRIYTVFTCTDPNRVV
ncbi:hypothetical protein H310_00914 [Aphanomyces invadans]|uniref:ERCC4 domain-containing protein n=1 Tax=Aphanomyces invadans TaxID=157072 RepID=A0A024UQ14_9STRA|nr:hypothetical protein H310_00914 [Aphanomyces invadans]ETW08295.1 hypothetical protein H310_00914 [Aphanomyces invadans]|eukprot:XP_008862100.1 hypothetical protein H310_00914 [Aphanomyces invadans]